MAGDATLFARRDEVEEAWRFIDDIEAAWRDHGSEKNLAFYPPPEAGDQRRRMR